MIEAIEYATAGQLAERKNFIAIRRRIAARAVVDDGIDLKRKPIVIAPELPPIAEPVPPPLTFGLKSRQKLIPHIQKLVAQYFDVTVLEMKDDCRDRRITFPRQIAMYFCRAERRYSYPEVARWFGARHHTTILHAVRKFEALQFTDAYVCQTLHEIRELIEASLWRAKDRALGLPET